MLLLETLTAFSQDKAPPSPPVFAGDALRNPLGDLLFRDTPELSQQERERFRQFFFALSIEARDPWPIERRGGAGAGGARTGHCYSRRGEAAASRVVRDEGIGKGGFGRLRDSRIHPEPQWLAAGQNSL
jgi:hypothetical protein